MLNIFDSSKSNKWMQHLLFWILVVTLLSIRPESDVAFIRHFSLEVFNVGFYAAIFYLNMYYIFPAYLNDKKLHWHIGYLLLVSIILTPIKTFTLFTLSSGIPGSQYFFVSNQYFIFLSNFFVSIGSSIYFALLDWLNTQKAKQELLNRNLQTELNFLRTQINPHFLFNTLNSLYALTLKKSEQAPEMVLKLSEMMRYMLYECNERMVPLCNELHYIENYLEMEKLRHGSKVQINMITEGDCDDMKIPPLLFIPFIENSFKHGVNPSLGGAIIEIYFKVDNSSVLMEVLNTKAEKSNILDAKKKSGGIGLENVKRRLSLLFSENYCLEITNNMDRYKVKLEINLDKVNQNAINY